MGFQAYAKIAGFDDYFGFEDYPNKHDFDGTWAIWDEGFLQFFASEMGKMKQPFVTSVFTASSHHPFHLPEQYKDKFPQGKHPIQQCIAYSDYSIRQFFQKVSQYDWYNNTLFVIVADHSHTPIRDEYFTGLGRYSIPILLYHPGSELRGLVDSIPVQQTDIMPSVLSYLNYDKPFFAYGQDVFTTKVADKFVINYNNGIYQLVKGDFLQQFDGEKTRAVYNYKTDTLLRNNIIGQVDGQDETETLTKSVVQQYIVRMTENRLRFSE
jgi:phosphoglycerol transferase MdoB-like AlkP superfamily enzyme